MSDPVMTHCRPGQPRSNVLGILGEVILGLVTRRPLTRKRRALSALPPHLLRDIGCEAGAEFGPSMHDKWLLELELQAK